MLLIPRLAALDQLRREGFRGSEAVAQPGTPSSGQSHGETEFRNSLDTPSRMLEMCN